MVVPFTQSEAADYSQALARAFGDFWPSLLISSLVSLPLAVLCYRRQMRYQVARSQRILWPLFVFLFGVPGWVGYLTCRSWPVLEPCPACGSIVPQDRLECAACQAGFPLPPRRGTEVLAA
jgi:hypothetical protein